MIQSIHHFAISSRNEECVAFYMKFGFKEFFRRKRKNDTIVLLDGYGIQIEIFVDASNPPRTNPEPLGLRHFAFKVGNIETTSQELAIEIGPIMNDWQGKRFTFCSDPDGNIIELHE